MPFTDGQLASPGDGGGGGGGVHAVIAQSDDSSKGIEVALDGDASWQLEGIQRVLGVRAKLEIPGATAGSLLTITAPTHLSSNDPEHYGDVNDWPLRVTRHTDPIAAVPEVPAIAEVPAVPAMPAIPAVAAASASVRLHNDANNYITITRDAAGSAGNDIWLRIDETADAYPPDGVQAGVSGDTLILVWSSIGANVPEAQDLVAEINNVSGFSAALGGGTSATELWQPPSLTVALPGGENIGSRRRQMFSGGADAVAEMFNAPAVSASITVGLGSGGSMLVTRVAGGVGGNSWDLGFEFSAATLGTDGLQVSTLIFLGRNLLKVLLSTTNRPSIASVAAALDIPFGNDGAFTSVLSGVSDTSNNFPNNTLVLLPDHETSGNIRYDDFTGGVDIIAGVPAVPAVPAIPAIPAIPAVPGGPISFEATFVVSRWTLIINRAHTLAEIAAEIRSEDIWRIYGAGPFQEESNFPDADIVIVGDDTSVVHADILPDVVGQSQNELFSGGVNEIPIGVGVDTDTNIVSVTYDSALDDAQTIVEAFDGESLVASALIVGTENDAILEVPPFIRTFRGIGGAGGSSTASVTLEKVPTIFRQAVLQVGLDQYDVTTTWRDLRNSRTEVLATGTAVEIGPVQIGNLADFVEIFGTGIVYCGSHTSPAGIGVEQKFQYAKADTESGTYSAYADINESTFTKISGGTITFRSKIAAGGGGGRQYADYMPATQVASTWEDMGFIAADVGKWIKIIVLHKKPSSDHPDIEQRYGWRLTLKVDSEVDRVVSVTVAAPGSGRYSNNPTLVKWGRAQDSRLPANDAGNWTRTGIRKFLRWKLDDSELFFGASADQIQLLTEVEAEALTNPDALPPNGSRADVFYKLQAGMWSGVIVASYDAFSYEQYIMARVNEAGLADDYLAAAGHTGVAGDPTTGSEIQSGRKIINSPIPLFKASADDVFYDYLSDTVTDFAVSQFKTLTYHGPV